MRLRPELAVEAIPPAMTAKTLIAITSSMRVRPDSCDGDAGAPAAGARDGPIVGCPVVRGLVAPCGLRVPSPSSPCGIGG